MRLGHLNEDGFVMEDCLEVILRIGPASYYQACLDQSQLLAVREERVKLNEQVLSGWEKEE